MDRVRDYYQMEVWDGEQKDSWAYNYSLFKHHDWIKTLCYLLAITVLIICFTFFIAQPHDFIGALAENLWVIEMIVARIFRNYVPMSHEMIVNERIGSIINLKDVRSIKLNKDADSISMKGFLILTTIYADKTEIDYIYQLIKQECVNLKEEK